MNVGVIGTGRMGSGLGQRWAASGHRVMFGSRTPDKAKRLADAIGNGADGGAIADATRFGEVVLLAVPWFAVRDIVQTMGNVDGKVLMDCINPVQPDYRGLAVDCSTSAAEEIAKMAPNADVVKAYNHVYAEVIHTNPQIQSQPTTVFYCGGDHVAKASVATLIADSGFEAVDAGGLTCARYLEALAMLMIHLASTQRMGTNMGLKLLRR